MSVINVFALSSARASRTQLEQLAGIIAAEPTVTAAMRQQIAAALAEVNDVIDVLERQLEPLPPITAVMPALPKRVPGATL